tara:strand:- start:11453 stop:12223 length:771 start_codon:yes stop_codon:yes gene_type:complete
MKLIKLSILLFVINCNTTEINKFSINQIKEVNKKFPNQEYKYPILKGNSEISNKINSKIINDLLDLDINKPHKSIFENVWSTEEKLMPSLSFLEYKVNILNSKLYSVTFQTESCGAYCEEFSISYNFNLLNGKEIIIDSMLTDSGKKSLLEKLNNQRENKLKKTIEELKKEQISSTEENDFEERIALLQSCLEMTSISSLEFINFKFEKEYINLFSDRCSNHAMRALDEVGRFEYSFKIDEINNLLNKYGKQILIK